MEKKIVLEKTDDTPEIILDYEKSFFKFEGISIPEDAEKFYQQIISYFEKYSESPNKNTNVEFKLLYYNSTSTLLFTKILKIFEKIHLGGNNVNIDWYYNQNDETVKEDGEEFANYFSMPFTLHMF